MAALLRRAQSLNIVTDQQCSVMVEMSALGFRGPTGRVDRERPRYVPGLIHSAVAAGMSEEELARCARLLPRISSCCMPRAKARRCILLRR